MTWKIENEIVQHPFFKDIPTGPMKEICSTAEIFPFEADEKLFSTGENADRLYIVLEGRIALQVAVPGREPMTIQTLEPDEVLGWSWLVPPFTWHFDARAVVSSQVIAIDGKTLRKRALEEDIQLGFVLYQRLLPVITQRLGSQQLQIVNILSSLY